MIYLRPLKSYDIENLFKIKSNPLNFNKKFTNFDTKTVTRESIKAWFYNFINEIDTVRLGICLSNNNILIGCITLGKVDYKNSLCELHINIDNLYQNKGYGKQSLLLLLEYIKNILKIKKVYLNVHKEHINAIHLYKKIGFNLIKELNNNFNTMEINLFNRFNI
tara:strand:- start:124 stop:615 length:492 start_codon:yes stop_codon:yes gene_type:complete